MPNLVSKHRSSAARQFPQSCSRSTSATKVRKGELPIQMNSLGKPQHEPHPPTKSVKQILPHPWPSENKICQNTTTFGKIPRTRAMASNWLRSRSRPSSVILGVRSVCVKRETLCKPGFVWYLSRYSQATSSFYVCKLTSMLRISS